MLLILSKLSVVTFVLLLAQLGQQQHHFVSCLTCFSCSTEAGDSFCTEDSFNNKLPSVVCPVESDVCVRAIQLNGDQVDNGNSKSPTSSSLSSSSLRAPRAAVGSTVFRSCGSSVRSRKPEITNLGFSPLYNECIVYKVVEKNNIYQNSTFQICSCSFDLGNSNGEMCNRTRK